jgi:hypothetical protein
MKVCSADLRELDAWATMRFGAAITRCGTCQPPNTAAARQRRCEPCQPQTIPHPEKPCLNSEALVRIGSHDPNTRPSAIALDDG